MVVVAYNKVLFTTASLFSNLNNKSSVTNIISSGISNNNNIRIRIKRRRCGLKVTWALAAAAGGDHNNNNNNSNSKKVAAASSSSPNYVVSFDSSSCITRPLAEILRDLNKRIPDNIIISNNNNNVNKTGAATVENDDDQQDLTAVSAHQDDSPSKTYIPWYHANRMLSFYAPGWCGEIRDVIFSDNGSVTVVYRVTIRGSDGEAHRESTGTVSPSMNGHDVDVVAAAEEIAFCRACARFGLGLYLYHDE